VATVLLIDAVHTSLGEGARHLSLEVATSNERAQALYRRFGFMPVGVRKRYYPVTGEDALVMWAYDLNSPAYSERLAAIAEWLAVQP
jgi:[ribosomal protein S18]-alanine N-acetyltransferase